MGPLGWFGLSRRLEAKDDPLGAIAAMVRFILAAKTEGGPDESMSLKKLLEFFDSDRLQLFEFERALIDQMIPFDRDAR